MKRLLIVLAVVVAFTFTAVAEQTAAGSSGTQASATKSKKKASGEAKEAGASASAKTSTLTGCVSSSPNSEGMYTLTNGRYKKGVEVGPADKVKDHAGHQVSLTGKWGSPAEAGEPKESAESKGERHFAVDNVKHISPTCSAAAGGGTTGTKAEKKGAAKKTE